MNISKGGTFDQFYHPFVYIKQASPQQKKNEDKAIKWSKGGAFQIKSSLRR